MSVQVWVKSLVTTVENDKEFFFPLIVHLDDSVAKVKKMIQTHLPLPKDHQLIFKEWELEDTRTLISYMIRPNDCMLLLIGVQFLKDAHSVGEVQSRLQCGQLKVDKDKGCVVWSHRLKEHYHVYWDKWTEPKSPDWRGREQPSIAELKKGVLRQLERKDRPLIDENGVEEPEPDCRADFYSGALYDGSTPPADEVFDRLDTRRVGYLTEKDLLSGLLLFRVVGKDDEIREWFKELDTNGDGRVDKKEFKVFMAYAYNAIFDPRNDVKVAILEKGARPMVFLGGSCNPTTWRKSIVIPLLEKQGITYYNPQVDKWNPSLVAEEAKAKESAELLFFVIDQRTLALASMIEVAELISKGRQMVLVLQHIHDGTVLEEKNGQIPAGATATGRVLQDANRARSYVKDIADRNHIKTYTQITQGVCAVVDFFQHQRKRASFPPHNSSSVSINTSPASTSPPTSPPTSPSTSPGAASTQGAGGSSCPSPQVSLSPAHASAHVGSPAHSAHVSVSSVAHPPSAPLSLATSSSSHVAPVTCHTPVSSSSFPASGKVLVGQSSAPVSSSSSPPPPIAKVLVQSSAPVTSPPPPSGKVLVGHSSSGPVLGPYHHPPKDGDPKKTTTDRK